MTLLAPPLAEALKASIPVIALVQEVTRDAVDRNAFQALHPGDAGAGLGPDRHDDQPGAHVPSTITGASKAGLMGFARNLAAELGPDGLFH